MTAFGLVVVCIILLALVQALQLGPRANATVRRGILVVLVVVVMLAVYAWTRME
jgi:hypothetical protein